MIPDKNGVIVELQEYGHHLITDVYTIAQVATSGLRPILVLRTTPHIIEPTERQPAEIYVRRMHHWFDEHKFPGTMIVLPFNWHPIGRPAWMPATWFDRPPADQP